MATLLFCYKVTNPLETDRSAQSDTDLIGNITTFATDEINEALSSNDPKQVLHQAQTIVAAIILIVSLF
jgi:hypothetical protein